MIGVYGLCDDLHQRDAVIGFADYHVDVDELYHWFGRVRVGLGLAFFEGHSSQLFRSHKRVRYHYIHSSPKSKWFWREAHK